MNSIALILFGFIVVYAIFIIAAAFADVFSLRTGKQQSLGVIVLFTWIRVHKTQLQFIYLT